MHALRFCALFIFFLTAQEQNEPLELVQPTPKLPPSRNGLRSQSLALRQPTQEELPPPRPSAVKKESRSRIAKPVNQSRIEKEEMPPPPPPPPPSEEKVRNAMGPPLAREPVAKELSAMAKRKSNCVKEVEKMQKKREERRLVASSGCGCVGGGWVVRCMRVGVWVWVCCGCAI